MKILIAEDEDDIRRLLTLNMKLLHVKMGWKL